MSKVQKHFDSEAKEYDSSLVQTNYWHAFDSLTLRLWNSMIPLNAKVLDAGCGTGRCSFNFVRRAKSVVAMDFSQEMLNQIRSKKKSLPAQLQKKITTKQGNLEKIPFKDNSFDVVCAHGVLQYLPNSKKAISELSRVLKPGGLYFGIEPHASILRSIYKKFQKLQSWNNVENKAFNTSFLISEFLKNNVVLETKISTYFPPFAFDILPKRVSKVTLESTDAILSAIPVARKLGGALILEGIKE